MVTMDVGALYPNNTIIVTMEVAAFWLKFRFTEAFVTFESGRAFLTAMILQYLARRIRPKVTLIDRHVCHWDVLNSSEGVKGPV